MAIQLVTDQDELRPLLSVDEVARLSGLSPGTIRCYESPTRRLGIAKGIPIPSPVKTHPAMWDPDDIDLWLLQRESRANAKALQVGNCHCGREVAIWQDGGHIHVETPGEDDQHYLIPAVLNGTVNMGRLVAEALARTLGVSMNKVVEW